MDGQEKVDVNSLRYLVSEFKNNPVSFNELERFISSERIVGRKLTKRERAYLHIANGSDTMVKGYDKCYHCGDPITSGLLCDDCKNEQVGDCVKCGERLYSAKTYECDGYDYAIKICDKCIAGMVRCNMSGMFGDACMVLVSRGKNVCASCSLPYCNTHIDNHAHAEFNRYQRGYSNSPIPSQEDGKLIKSERLVGVELEAIGGNYKKLAQSINRCCGIAHDGSLSGINPVEIQSPPSNKKALEEIVHNMCSSLSDAGFGVNKSCGLHIHLDAHDFSNKPTKIRQVINTYYAIEPVIYSMLPPSRTNNAYAQPLSNWITGIGIKSLSELSRATLSRFQQEWYKTESKREIDRCLDRKYDSSRYHGLNLHPLFVGGHIEMRYHHGTVSTSDILYWIALHQAIIDWALHDYSESVIESILGEKNHIRKTNKMLKYLGLPTPIRRYVRSKIRVASSIKEE